VCGDWSGEVVVDCGEVGGEGAEGPNEGPSVGPTRVSSRCLDVEWVVVVEFSESGNELSAISCVCKASVAVPWRVRSCDIAERSSVYL